MSDAANDFLMGNGKPSAKFKDIGATVGGKITRVGDPIQQTDFTSGALKTWDDGKPMMQLPVDVQTEQRDSEIVDDDGVRTLYVKGGLRTAVVEAVRAAGARGLAVGGTLQVRYVSDGVASKRGLNPPKVYAAKYDAPSAAFVQADDPWAAPVAAAAAAPVSDEPPF